MNQFEDKPYAAIRAHPPYASRGPCWAIVDKDYNVVSTGWDTKDEADACARLINEGKVEHITDARPLVAAALAYGEYRDPDPLTILLADTAAGMGLTVAEFIKEIAKTILKRQNDEAYQDDRRGRDD